METRTILFVDDEEKILSSLKRGLADEPYNLLFADSGKKALEILEQNEVHVIVTDLSMPNMSGVDLLEAVREKYPHIIRLVLSGANDVKTVFEAINKGVIFRFISKPWNFENELKIILRQAIEYYDLHSDREMLMGYFEQLAGGISPEDINMKLIQALIEKRKEHLYEWNQKCRPVCK
jgi:two-component system, NtrC family, response regulator HupR/HoxA